MDAPQPRPTGRVIGKSDAPAPPPGDAKPAPPTAAPPGSASVPRSPGAPVGPLPGFTRVARPAPESNWHELLARLGYVIFACFFVFPFMRGTAVVQNNERLTSFAAVGCFIGGLTLVAIAHTVRDWKKK